MYDTLKLLSGLVDTDMLGLTLEDLALEYQVSPNTKVLATAYDKIYKLAILLNEQYWGLDKTDYPSFCLEKLDFCLKTYKSPGKFTTYFSKVYKNKLREETEKLNYKKRKCLLQSINDIVEMGVEDTYNLLELILPSNLTSREREVCIMKSEGYENKDCAEKLKVSKMTISNIEKSLRIKLSTLQNQ